MQTIRSDRGPVSMSGPLASVQPTITNDVQREVEEFNLQTPRRARVVNRLIFLQVALLAMTAPLVVWPAPQPGAIIVLAAGLATYGVAWLSNLTHRVPQAQAILLAGSLVITTANIIGQFFWHPGAILPVGLASLPFILTILEAGLLFGPEIVLLVAVATAIFTAVLFALALLSGTETLSTSETYLLAVVSLGLQALAGMIAWQIASFIADFSNEVAQSRREEFIITQYEALRRSMEASAWRLQEQIKALIEVITKLSMRDYTARAMLGDGELKPLGEVVNVLAMQLASLVGQQRTQENTDNVARRITTLAGQLAEGDMAAPPPALPVTSPLIPSGPLDAAMVLMQQARARMQHRFGHVRDIALDAGQRLKLVDDQTVGVFATIAESQATIGQLRNDAERMIASAKRLNLLIDDVLTALGAILPPEVRAQSRMLTSGAGNNPALQQVMPGVTVQLDVITEDMQLGEEDQAPLAPPPAAPPAPTGNDPQTQATVREVWRLIMEMTEEVAKQVRDTDVLQDKLASATRSGRTMDLDLSKMRATLNEIRGLAHDIYQTTSTTTTHALGSVAPDASNTPPGGLNAADLIQRPASGPRTPSRPLRPNADAE